MITDKTETYFRIMDGVASQVTQTTIVRPAKFRDSASAEILAQQPAVSPQLSKGWHYIAAGTSGWMILRPLETIPWFGYLTPAEEDPETLVACPRGRVGMLPTKVNWNTGPLWVKLGIEFWLGYNSDIMLFTVTHEGKLVLNPLPNIYRDTCKICTGRIAGSDADDLVDRAEAIWTQVCNNLWNTDLLYDTAALQKLIRYDKTTMNQKESLNTIADFKDFTGPALPQLQPMFSALKAHGYIVKWSES